MSDVDPVEPRFTVSREEADETAKMFQEELKKARKEANASYKSKEVFSDATRKGDAVAQMNQEYNAWTGAEAPTLFEGGIV